MSTNNTTTLGSSTQATGKVNQEENTSKSDAKNPWVLAGLLQMANDTIEDFGQLQTNVSKMSSKMNENTLVQAKTQHGKVEDKIKLSKDLDIASTVLTIVSTAAAVGTIGFSLVGVYGLTATIPYILAGAAGSGKMAVGGLTAFKLAPLEKEIGVLEASSESTMTDLKDTTTKLRSMSETQSQIQSGYVSAKEKITQSMV